MADPSFAAAPVLGYDLRLTADELTAFIENVRANCDDALARLDAVDPATLPRDIRELYEQQRARWCDLRALTEGDAVDLHRAAAEHAGSELTQGESRALLRKQ